MSRNRRVSLDGGVEIEEPGVIQTQSIVTISTAGSLGFEFGIDCNSGRIVLISLRRGGLIATAAPGLLKYLDRLDAIGDMSEQPRALSAEHDFRCTTVQAGEYKRVHETSTLAEQEETARHLVQHAVKLLTTTPRPYTLLFHRPTLAVQPTSNPATRVAANRDIIVASVATLRKRRKARRMSTVGPPTLRHLAGVLLKKSKQGRWQPRFFTTSSHYLMYKKTATSEDFIGGIDLGWSETSITFISYPKKKDGSQRASELRVVGLDGDAHDKGLMHRERRTFTLRGSDRGGEADTMTSLRTWHDALIEVRDGLAVKARALKQLSEAAKKVERKQKVKPPPRAPLKAGAGEVEAGQQLPARLLELLVRTSHHAADAIGHEETQEAPLQPPSHSHQEMQKAVKEDKIAATTEELDTSAIAARALRRDLPVAAMLPVSRFFDTSSEEEDEDVGPTNGKAVDVSSAAAKFKFEVVPSKAPVKVKKESAEAKSHAAEIQEALDAAARHAAGDASRATARSIAASLRAQLVTAERDAEEAATARAGVFAAQADLADAATATNARLEEAVSAVQPVQGREAEAEKQLRTMLVAPGETPHGPRPPTTPRPDPPSGPRPFSSKTTSVLSVSQFFDTSSEEDDDEDEDVDSTKGDSRCSSSSAHLDACVRAQSELPPSDIAPTAVRPTGCVELVSSLRATLSEMQTSMREAAAAAREEVDAAVAARKRSELEHDATKRRLTAMATAKVLAVEQSHANAIAAQDALDAANTARGSAERGQAAVLLALETMRHRLNTETASRDSLQIDYDRLVHESIAAEQLRVDEKSAIGLQTCAELSRSAVHLELAEEELDSESSVRKLEASLENVRNTLAASVAANAVLAQSRNSVQHRLDALLRERANAQLDAEESAALEALLATTKTESFVPRAEYNAAMRRNAQLISQLDTITGLVAQSRRDSRAVMQQCRRSPAASTPLPAPKLSLV